MSYASTQASAAAMLAAKGQTVTLTRHAAGSYDTSDGSVTLTDSTTSTTGVLLPLSRGFTHREGTNIRAGDQQLLLPGSITAPAIDDTVAIGSDSYTIIEVSPLNPGGTVLLYDCIVR